MEALIQQEECLAKLAGVISSVDTLMTLLDKRISEASVELGSVAMEAIVEPAKPAREAILQFKERLDIVVGTLEAAKAAEKPPSFWCQAVTPPGPISPPGSNPLLSPSGEPPLLSPPGPTILGTFGTSGEAKDASTGERAEMTESTEAGATVPGCLSDPEEAAAGDNAGASRHAGEEVHGSQPQADAEAPADTRLAIRSYPAAATDETEGARYLFYPSWNGKLVWDLSVMLVVICDAMVLPFQLSFKHGMPEDSFDTVWFYITLSVFSSDLFVTFNTAIQSEDIDGTGECSFNTSRREIAKVYLKTWFTIDFVSTFPWSKIAELTSDGEAGLMTQVTKLLKMLKFARIIRLMKMLRARTIKDIWEKFEVAIGSIVIVQSMMLLRILLVVVAICHWFACLFWIIGSPVSLVTELLPVSTVQEFQKVPHWTTIKRSYGPEQGDWTWRERPLSEKYFFCFYWTLGVMRTMPAEVTPVNLTERVFVLLFMFFALSAFAISVASLTQAYFKINERGRGFGDEMFFIRMHLSKMKMNDASQRRIKDYLAHLYERRRILAKEANLLDKMPEVLKQEVHSAKIALQLNKLSVTQTLSKDTIKELCVGSKTFDLMPEQTICVSGETSEATWIIVKGVASAVDAAGEPVISETPLEVIDEKCLSTENTIRSELTVITTTCCEVVKIEKEVFMQAVANHESWATVRKPSKTVADLPGGPQKIDVCAATDNRGDDTGASSAAAAALSA